MSQTEKYGNTFSTCKLGHSHRSKLESSVCAILQLREKAGEIRIDQAEDHICLCGPKEHDCPGKIDYVADFRCTDLATGETFWVEAKGYANDRWPMKKRLYKHYGPGRLEIWRGTATRPFLDETILPRGEK